MSDATGPPGRVNLNLGQIDDELTTDDDRSEAGSLTPAQSKRYEQQVGRILGGRSDTCERSDKTHLIGRSGARRQIDVLFVTHPWPGVNMNIVVECKYYRRKVGIGVIDELIGKVQDVGAPLGVLCAPNGFSGHARRRAEESRVPQIELVDLSGDEDLDVDIGAIAERYATFDCPALFCGWGEVSWDQMIAKSGETIAVGRCDRCGTLAIKCEDCGESEQEECVLQCSCGYSFTTTKNHHNEFDGVVRTDEDGNEVEFIDWTTSKDLTTDN